MKKFLLAAAVAALTLGAPAFADSCCSGGDKPAHATKACEFTEAVAVMHPTAGNTAQGTVRFVQKGDKVTVIADLTGLAPNSTHGFHVHEFGDCTAPDASSAGGHYNPEGHSHAGPETAMRHAGDLGNLKSDAQGKAHLELTVDNLSLCGPKNPILGRAVIVHAKADDLKSQPTGESGPRIACGVIGIAKK